MASIQLLKSRIRSVKNTKQITKAMQMVAASKMRRAQEATKASAPYTIEARKLLSRLSSHSSITNHPLFTARPIQSRLIILIGSDKGLAGAYNSNILRVYANEIVRGDTNGTLTKTITVGRKAGSFVSRLKDTELIGVYEDFPDKPTSLDLHAILDTAKDLYESNEVDAVDVIYTEFQSGIKQTALLKRIIPITYEATPVESVNDATYEPSTDEVIDAIAYRLIGAQLFQAFLDARASEHSMRMIAMKNATDNASDLVDDLTLAMNKARQGAITQELAEISGGVEALSE